MKVTVRLHREQTARIVVDTAEFPRETEGWDALDDKALHEAAIEAAWEIVDNRDFESDPDWDDADVIEVRRA